MCLRVECNFPVTNLSSSPSRFFSLENFGRFLLGSTSLNYMTNKVGFLSTKLALGISGK